MHMHHNPQYRPPRGLRATGVARRSARVGGSGAALWAAPDAPPSLTTHGPRHAWPTSAAPCERLTCEPSLPPQAGKTKLLVFDDGDGAAAELHEYGEADGLPHFFGGLAPAPDGTLYMMGGAPDVPSGVYAWGGLQAGAAPAAAAALLACSSSNRVPDGYVSIPRCVEFPCPLGTAYGYYYAPTNAECTSAEAAPPLLVKVRCSAPPPPEASVR
jgi:hypothetical protein